MSLNAGNDLGLTDFGFGTSLWVFDVTELQVFTVTGKQVIWESQRMDQFQHLRVTIGMALPQKAMPTW